MSQAILARSVRILSRRLSRHSVILANMSEISVRCVPDEERMQISVNYNNRTYNMERLKDEEIGRCFVRLQANIMKVLNKNKRRKKKKLEPEETEAIKLSIFNDGQILEETTKNVQAWMKNSVLVIGDEKLKMDINPPTVKSLSLPTSIMAGFPIFPKSETEFCVGGCHFVWYREPLPTASKEMTKPVEISKDVYFTPSINEIGHRLRLTLVPVNGEVEGKEMSVTSKFEVEAGPGLCPFEKRQIYTQKQTETGSLRVVSYNILADIYADSDFSRTYLYPYIPPYALQYDYRKQLLLKEIAGYNSDIICLQEVDKKAFDCDYSPALDVLGFGTLMKEKGGQVCEGSALFYRRSKLRLIGQHDIILSEVLMKDENYSDIWQKVSSVEALKEKMLARTTALQLAVFEASEKSNHVLCVANTHLYFHPDASHIRLLQIAVCMRHLETVITQFQLQGKCVSFIFCGDFNSIPQSEINTFMTTKFISADYHLWNSCGEKERLTDLELKHSYNIISGCNYTDYTNYTSGFHGMLDYIFIDSDNLCVTQVIPPPEHEAVIMNTALPSIVFPSDHIAQICDIKWK